MGFFDGVKSFFKSSSDAILNSVSTHEITRPQITGDETIMEGYKFEKSPYLFYTGNGALELDTAFTVADSQDDAEDKIDDQIFVTGISIGIPQQHKNFNPQNYKVSSVSGNPLIKQRIEYDVAEKEMQGVTIPAKHVIAYLADIQGKQKEIILDIYNEESFNIKAKATDALELIASTLSTT